MPIFSPLMPVHLGKAGNSRFQPPITLCAAATLSHLVLCHLGVFANIATHSGRYEIKSPPLQANSSAGFLNMQAKENPYETLHAIHEIRGEIHKLRR